MSLRAELGPPRRTELTAALLDVVPSVCLVICAGNPRHFQHLHHPIKQPMHNFKASGLVAPDCSSVSHILRLALNLLVLEDDVGRLKDSDGKRVRAILSDSFEETWEERRAHDLKFQRLWVCDLYGLATVILAV